MYLCIAKFNNTVHLKLQFILNCICAAIINENLNFDTLMQFPSNQILTYFLNIFWVKKNMSTGAKDVSRQSNLIWNCHKIAWDIWYVRN